jgi:hypothetical protein
VHVALNAVLCTSHQLFATVVTAAFAEFFESENVWSVYLLRKRHMFGKRDLMRIQFAVECRRRQLLLLRREKHHLRLILIYLATSIGCAADPSSYSQENGEEERFDELWFSKQYETDR